MRGYKEEKADSESSGLERSCRELREVDQDIYETEVLKVEVGLQQYLGTSECPSLIFHSFG